MRRGGTSRLTWRRFRNFLNRLPANSHYQTALRNSLTEKQIQELSVGHDPATESWSRLEHLAAGLDERLQQLLIAVLSALGVEPPQFRPIYRPGVPISDGDRPETLEERDERRAALRAKWDATTTTSP
ncbi:hypothetical protein [Streptodolium elevatio]|uniref:Uncharacterized protein n=1 Tax=Streptodolium elevatio TaxID=3157996 RepID=A0ABV3DLF0_9ACTN